MSFLSRITRLLRPHRDPQRISGAEPDGQPLAVPRHVAIIMDGNNRWARQRKLPPGSGHRAGVETIRKVLGACEKHGVAVLTLFAFSSENWQRPPREVQELMKLLRNYLDDEIGALHERGMRVRFIGRRDRLDNDIARMMADAEQKTAGNEAGTLVLAIDYGGRWDIANAALDLAKRVGAGELSADAIDEELLGNAVSMADLPAPDLCIRTGAEYRLSNFLLWQLSYAELYFCDCFWPDFDEREFTTALLAYGKRQRRYGLSDSQHAELAAIELPDAAANSAAAGTAAPTGFGRNA